MTLAPQGLSAREVLRDYLPPEELWPERVFALPQYRHPDRINLVEVLLDRNIQQGQGDKIAIYSGEECVTYHQLYEKVNRLASSLTCLGVGKYDRVMLRLANSPEFIISWLAVIKIGAIGVATMPLLRRRELASIANDSEARLIIVSGDLMAEIEQASDQFTSVKKMVLVGQSRSGYYSWEELVEKGVSPYKTEDTDRDDPALIYYTSGSTGTPKGAAHFHEDVLNCAEAYGQHILAPSPEDVFGSHATMAFTFGLGASLVFPLRFGASVALVPSFSPEGMFEAIERYRITILFGTPTSFRMMLAKQEKTYDLSSLRICPCAGEPLPATVFHQWQDTFGVELLEHIGSTEMLYAFLSNIVGQARPGSCGLPIPGYQAKVVDEDFNELPAGEPGLLAVKGPIGCRYWRKPERQKEYVRFGGWNFPTDIFVKDKEGYFYYQCRADDLIISGGYNIAGIEIEQTLTEHPAVAEAAVIGAPDPVRGQKVKAFVVVKEGYNPSPALVEELQNFIKNTVAPFKYPREIEFVAALPRTETGKIRRVELREKEARKHQQPEGASRDSS